MPDIILHNGRFLTQDAALPVADALAVTAGRIVAVGSEADVTHLAGRLTRRLDLRGRTVVPGFNDAHCHLWKMGHLMEGLLDLRGISSLCELRQSLASFAARLPEGAWLAGRGYNEAEMGRAPTALDLDEAAPGRPVFLTRTCGHIAVASTAALGACGIGPETVPPPGGEIVRDERGIPTGVLHETAMGLVSSRIPEPSAGELERMILSAARHQLSLGVTSSSDAGVTPSQLAAYVALEERGALPLRVNAMTLRRPLGGTQTFPLPEKRAGDFLRSDTVKLLADGGLSGATAALREPYRHCNGHGLLRLDREEIVELAREAHSTGLRVAVHAIGDAAIETVLDAFEELGIAHTGVRHRLEHFGLPDAAQLARAARLKLISVPQAVFLHALGANFRRYLRDGLLARSYPLREMLDAGLTVALSSDAPVVRDDNPLLGMRCAVLRCDAGGEPIAAEQAIGIGEALRAYTLGGAIASGDEANRGSIVPGKWADLAVLSGNPLSTSPERLTEIQVDMTFVGGHIAFQRQEMNP